MVSKVIKKKKKVVKKKVVNEKVNDDVYLDEIKALRDAICNCEAYLSKLKRAIEIYKTYVPQTKVSEVERELGL